jgi:hypothetical protein
MMHQANIPPDVDLDHLGEFIEETGLDLYQIFGHGNIESVQEVDLWKPKIFTRPEFIQP